MIPSHALHSTLLLAAFFAAAAASVAQAQSGDAALIPEDRRMDWKPGIPGGIPVYPVFASVKDAPYSAKGDGQADDTAALQKALDDCPEGKAVLVPAGTYRLTAELKLTKGVVLRGEGPEKTRLINEANAQNVIGICNWDNYAGTRILKGYTKGSTTLAVEDSAKLKVGDLLLVDQLNDPEFVDIVGAGGLCKWAGREDGKRAMGQLVMLAAKDGNTLTLNRPLAFTFKEALAPEAVRTTDKTITRAGIEDLYTEMTCRKREGGSSIKIWNAIYCWVKNVECCRGWEAGHVTLKHTLGCEVRDSYFHHAHRYGTGHGYGVIVAGQSTDTLVENNICYHLNTGPQISTAGPGNVASYNYSSIIIGRDYPKTNWAHPGLAMHAAHSYLNLFEGNQASGIHFDNYWGSASHDTVFRNALDMRPLRVDRQPMTQNVVGVRIDKNNLFMNVLGNVLGHEGMQGQLEPTGTPDLGTPWIWCLGHPGNPKVAQTLLRHGNYDFVSKQTQWDPKIPDHKLPASLYLAAKPAFFGKLPWPPIGPDLTPMVGSIPAQERFMKISTSEREAQDLLYQGEYFLATDKKDEALPVLQQVVAKYGESVFAKEARKELEKAK